MPIDLPKDLRDEALASLQMYTRTAFDEPLGSIAAADLLDFFLEEIAPCVYNKAVTDVQERLQARLLEIDVALHHPPFTYWQRKSRR